MFSRSLPASAVLWILPLAFFLAAGCGSQSDNKKDTDATDKTMRITMEITGMS